MTRRRRLLPRMHRATGRLAVAGVVLAVATCTAVITLGAGMSSASNAADVAFVRAPSDTVTTEVDTDDHALTLAASPVTDLPRTNAHITVRGTGFDTDSDLWIAVCQDDGAAPAALLHCLGGDIPDHNATTAWGVVTPSRKSEYAGPVVTHWKHHGSFTMTLQIPSAWDQFANCMAASCSIYARSSQDEDVVDGLSIPVSFGAGAGGPTTSSSPPPPTTETIGAAPTTVDPEIVQSTSITPGGKQTVLFAGFVPGEDVDVTLFSDPITLPKVRADDSGNVRIEFTVPDDLPPGQHLVEAVGRQSNRVGIAPFAVTAPTTSTSSSATPTTTASDTAGSTASDTAAENTDIAGAGGRSTATDTAAANGGLADGGAGGSGTAGSETAGAATEVAGAAGPTAPISTVSSVAVPGQAAEVAAPSATAATPTAGATDRPQEQSTGSRLLWLWIVLVALVLVALIAGVIVMLRSRRDRYETARDVAGVQSYAADEGDFRQDGVGAGVDGGVDPDAADAGGWTSPAWSEPRFGEPALLSGSYDRPDEPPVPSDRPTEVVDENATRQVPSDTSDDPTRQVTPPDSDSEPHTEQWQPDFTVGRAVDADDPALEDLDGPPTEPPSGPPSEPQGGRHRSE